MKPEDVLKEMVARAKAEYAKVDLEDKAKELDLEGPLQVHHGREPRPGRGQHARRLPKMSAVVYNRLKPTNAETNQMLEFDSTYNYLKGQSKIDIFESRRSGTTTTRTTRTSQGSAARADRQPGRRGARGGAEPDHGGWLLLRRRSTARRDRASPRPRRAPEAGTDKFNAQRRNGLTADAAARRAAVLGSPDRPLPLPGAAPRRLRGTGPDGLDVRPLRGGRGGAARASCERLGARVGGAVADHAAQARGHPAAGRDQRDGRLRRGRQHRRLHRGRAPHRRQHRHPRHGRRPARARHRAGRARRGARRRAPPRPPRWPRSPGSAPARSPRTSAARPGPPRCGGGASGSDVDGAHGRLGGRRRGAATRRWSIATTPAGATDALAARRARERPGTLFDVLYDPWPTALAAAWSGDGGAVVGGLDLLVHQAVLQVEQMTGRAPAPAGRDARGGRGGAAPRR